MEPDQEKFAKLLDEQADRYSKIMLESSDKEPTIAALTAAYIFTGLADIVRKMGTE